MLIAAQTKTQDYWYEIADRIAERIGASAAAHDRDKSFVAENYDLKARPHYSQSAEALELIRRAFGYAETATDEFVRDPLSYDVPTEMLLSKDNAKRFAAQVTASLPKPAATALVC